MARSPDVTFAVRALARYLLANPQACDTPDGILRWWLAAYSVSMEELLSALEWMKQQGLVEELLAADGRLRYRRSATDDRLAAIAGDRPAEPATRH
jgi:hypothetical protein